MKKSKEILQAELIVADLLKNDGDPKRVLDKARDMRDNRNFAIAQRVTATIFLVTLYDLWEDFTQKDVKSTYEEYLKYFESFSAGNENIANQMLEIDKMLDGDLLSSKLFDIIKERADEET